MQCDDIKRVTEATEWMVIYGKGIKGCRHWNNFEDFWNPTECRRKGNGLLKVMVTRMTVEIGGKQGEARVPKLQGDQCGKAWGMLKNIIFLFYV